jgi:3-oxoadipate enol-lactonase
VTFADLDRLRMYYERGGDPDGPRLLFFNGTGGDLRTQPSALTWPIAQGFDLVAFDQRGLGQTDKPEGPYEMADYAADAIELMDLLGWDSCRVIGISFGGMVAQEVAVTVPERIERLALCCTSSGGQGGASYPLHELRDLEPAEERVARHVEVLNDNFTREWQAAHPDMVRVFAERGRDIEPGSDADRGARLQLDARSRHDVYDRLPRITCPTLVASGRGDGIAPPANGKAIASQIDGSEYAEFDGGHLFFVLDQSAWPKITSFLRQ